MRRGVALPPVVSAPGGGPREYLEMAARAAGSERFALRHQRCAEPGVGS